MTESEKTNIEKPVPLSDDMESQPFPVASDSSFLLVDEDYKKLLSFYQQADWEACARTLDLLLRKYQDDPYLLELKEDIDIQYAIYHKADEEAHKKRRISISPRARNILIALAIVAILGAVGVKWGGKLYQSLTTSYNPSEKAEQIAALESLESQARALIKVGKVNESRVVLDRIRAIDPEYKTLPELTALLDSLALVEANYDIAMQLVAQGKPHEALPILEKIQNDYPLYKDIAYQVDIIRRQIKVNDLLKQAASAYQNQQWDVVIASYEEVLQLQPDIQQEGMEEQLFLSYYNQIEGILQNPQATVSDIDKAEEYYNKAVALVPQDKAFANERQNLQKIMRDLLVVKYQKTARMFIEDPNLDQETLLKALTYLKKVSSVQPDNQAMAAELSRAQNYVDGVQAFNKKDWDTAIAKFQRIVSFDKSYAGGMVRHLLYEAYMLRGYRYYSVGYYSYARSDFEAAEILAWEQTENDLQLFQVQIMLGYTLGYLDKYEDAVSYFEYAIQKFNVKGISNDPNFIASLEAAQQLAARKKFYDAYTLYAEAFQNPESLYGMKTVKTYKGQNLASIAKLNLSTIRAIYDVNNVSDTIVLKADQELRIPALRRIP